MPEFLGIDPPGPAPLVAPRTYIGIPPKATQGSLASSVTAPSSSADQSALTEPPAQSGADTLSTATTMTAPKARPSAADDDAEVDQLIKDAGEDELEKLLRELEGL